jgi:DNA-binding GntR family transcriptional regulator
MAAKEPTASSLTTRESLVEQAYSVLRRRILDNVYAPGHQALERPLAEELGISRTPVREALIRLANEGLVEVIPRHGMRVLPVSPSDMVEIYCVLAALEAAAGELIARRHPTAAQLAPLTDATQQMIKALKVSNLDAWAAADKRFHHGLLELAGNNTLMETAMALNDRMHRARMFTLRLRPTPLKSAQEHMAMLDRIGAGDARGAGEACRAHLDRVCVEFMAIFDRYRLSQM